jgi:hypothetical protein
MSVKESILLNKRVLNANTLHDLVALINEEQQKFNAVRLMILNRGDLNCT